MTEPACRLLAVPLFVALAPLAAQAHDLHAKMSSYQEVPAVSSTAAGSFKAHYDPRDPAKVTYELSYEGLEGDVTQAHIHFGQRGVNGGISVFLCSNLGNGPAGTQPCPPAPATIQGTFSAADVIGPNAQGIAAGEFDELIDAIVDGTAYANVHSTKYPGGEVRGQIQ